MTVQGELGPSVFLKDNECPVTSREASFIATVIIYSDFEALGKV